MSRENWLLNFVYLSRSRFEAESAPLPENIRVSIGFPSTGVRSKTIGQCWYSGNSADGAVEIFIRPSLQDDAARIADVLTHELVHAALGAGKGHGKDFRKLATALGLEGKMTATVAGDAWRAWALPLIEGLGPFPGAALHDAGVIGGKRTQTTRYLKVTCTHCDFVARVTAKHLHSELNCPVPACGGNLLQELG